MRGIGILIAGNRLPRVFPDHDVRKDVSPCLCELKGEMEVSIGPAYIWMILCVGLLLIIILLSSLICCFCCSQKSKRINTENTSHRLGSSRLAVHSLQDLEEEEQALTFSRSFSTFSPKPLPSDESKNEVHEDKNFLEFPEFGTVGASKSAPSLMSDPGSCQMSDPGSFR